MKKFLCVALALILCFSSTVFASPLAPSPINNFEIAQEDMVLENRTVKSTRSANGMQAITETYSAIICIDTQGNATVVDKVALPRAASTGENSNTYWKATVTIDYDKDGAGYGRMSYVSGSWIQLHGVTTLSGRSVTYTQNYTSKTAGVSSNSFSLATGFSATALTSLRASTSATITTQAGITTNITASVAWNR